MKQSEKDRALREVRRDEYAEISHLLTTKIFKSKKSYSRKRKHLKKMKYDEY